MTNDLNHILLTKLCLCKPKLEDEIITYLRLTEAVFGNSK